MKLKFLILSCSIALIALFQSGCKYDIEDELYPPTVCDTTDVSYIADILPILDLNCLGCHNPVDLEGGITLEPHAELQIFALNGSLVCSLEHDPACSAMPDGGEQLSSCSIDKIKSWVNDGALEN